MWSKSLLKARLLENRSYVRVRKLLAIFESENSEFCELQNFELCFWKFEARLKCFPSSKDEFFLVCDVLQTVGSILTINEKPFAFKKGKMNCIDDFIMLGIRKIAH